MQAVSTALNQVLEAGSWFVRAHEVHCWVVRVSADLRKPALQLITGLEFFPENRAAFVCLPDAHTPADRGWQVRANRVIAHWSDRRTAFLDKEGIEMPEAKLLHSGLQYSSPISPMQDACLAISTAVRAPLDGFVVVLAPTVIADFEAMSAEVETLVNDPALAAIRWIWVLDAEVPWPDMLDRLGERGLRCECIADPEQQKSDLAAIISAPPGMIGRAGPRGVTPPRRIDDPPPLPPEKRAAMLRDAGVNPEYLEKAPELQRLILSAAVAMKNGEGREAIRQQREAADLALALELFDVTVLCRIGLGMYLCAMSERDEALGVLRGAAGLANEHGFALQEAQAYLGIGVLLALAERYAESAHAYTVSARCAEAAKVPVLAIEAWRMAGQVAAQGGDEQVAYESFREAIRVAEGSDAASVKDSTASEAARKLADLCDRLNMPEQARCLREQADAMDSGEIGTREPVLVEA